MSHLKVDVVLLLAHSSSLHNLHGHRAGDDVARRKILRIRRVALHETLALRVYQETACKQKREIIITSLLSHITSFFLSLIQSTFTGKRARQRND